VVAGRRALVATEWGRVGNVGHQTECAECLAIQASFRSLKSHFHDKEEADYYKTYNVYHAHGDFLPWKSPKVRDFAFSSRCASDLNILPFEDLSPSLCI